MTMHRINRVEIELHGGDQPLLRALCERISQIHQARVAPVVERACSQLGGSDGLVRLEQLDVDLGTIAADAFEDTFVAKLEKALHVALAAALGRRVAGADPHIRAALELVETFALTGSIPWWAGPHDDEVVARHIAQAARAEDELVALIGRLASDPQAVDRIARACDGDALVVLAEHVQPGGEPLLRGADLNKRRVLLATLAMRAGRGAPEHRTAERQATGRMTVGGVAAGGPEDTAERGPRPNEHTAGHRVRTPSSPGNAETAAAANPASRSGHQQSVDVTTRHPSARAADRPLDEPRSAPDDALTIDATQRRPPSADEQRPTSAGRRTATPSVLEASSIDEQPATAPGSGAATPFEVAPRSIDERPPAAGTSAATPSVVAPLDMQRGAVNAPRLLPTPAIAAISTVRRRALARLDELYVDDAGLVILWPFLDRFLVRVGLLAADHQFLDETAQLQAVAQVETLATADPAPLEFHLPLAKLLCGRRIESDFPLEHPVTPVQLAEADYLLAAVIDRAPVLGGLSISSFRAGFLQRSGALSTRDGAWLLQVERRAHDVVLDHLPWSWSWIKLPWMPEPLRVEW